MGAYLSEPVVEKHSEAGSNEQGLSFGASTMQGWRTSQEDAHNCIVNFAEKCSIFAVYDGHGGAEVAEYSAKLFPDFLKKMDTWKEGRIGQALEDAFLAFDQHLIEQEAMDELKALAGVKNKQEDGSDDDDDNKALMYEEAFMPLEAVLLRYGVNIAVEGMRRDGKPHEIDLSPKKKKLLQKSDSVDHDDENTPPKSPADDFDAPASKQKGLITPEKKKGRHHAASAPSNGTIEGKAEEDKESEQASPDCGSPKPKRCRHFADGAAMHPEEQTDGGVTLNGDVKKGGTKVPTKTLLSELDNEASETESDSSDEDEGEEYEDGDGEHSPDEEGGSASDEDEIEDSSEEGEHDTGEDSAEAEEELPLPNGETPGVDSGTTACVAVVKGSMLYVANAGDSRCVLCRSGRSVDLSVDHKPEDIAEQERIERAGGRVTSDGRVNGGLNLSRALGDHFYKRNNDLSLREQMITALPDVRVESLTPEDSFMVLACDGIWNSMSSQEVVDFVQTGLNENIPLDKLCEQLCDHCLATNTIGDGTGCDNMTAIVVKFAPSAVAVPHSTNCAISSTEGDSEITD